MALVVGVGFLSPSGITVILGYVGVAEHLGCVGCFTPSASRAGRGAGAAGETATT